MANIKLLQEAIQAFANGEDALADKKMRKYFVEAAQEINKQLEEEMEEELDESTEECEEEEVIEEDFNTAPDQGLNGEIQYALDEADDVETDVDAEAESFTDADDEVETDVDAESETEVESDDVPTGDEWASIKDAFAGLSKMFQDAAGEADDIDFDDSEEHEDMDIDVDVDGEDEYADVDFGEKQFGESFQLKKVGEVDKKEKAGVHDKSPVAKNAKSPVDGVSPVKIKDGTVVTNDGDLLKNKDAETVKVDDMNNVMDNGKNVMKPAKTPKNTAAQSRSPLPKNAPKF